MKKELRISAVVCALALGIANFTLAIERIYLSTVNASFRGENPNDNAGISLAIAGDVNGDGYDDVLIGTRYAGKAYLILGKVSSWSMDLDLSDPTVVDASFIEEIPGDQAGRGVSGAGDVNGDGYDDILIGADHNSEGGYRAGKTYLIFGKSTGWALNTSLSNADASFIGDGGRSGALVIGGGDVNGDGYDDFLISAHERNSHTGCAYLILGKPSGWMRNVSLSDPNEVAASFIGESLHNEAGPGDIAGDVNGDGYDDILIGAGLNDEGGTDAGQAYLIFGKPSGWQMNTSLSNSDASFLGESSSDRAGYGVSFGDVNGDGYDDILIGAVNNDYTATDAGQIYLILGKLSGWNMDTPLTNCDASFIGEASGDKTYQVKAGDINGDGYDDILIGAYWNDYGGTDAGQTYLIWGKDSDWQMRTPLSNADISFVGEHAGDGSGHFLSVAGDVNGNGYADIVIGAYYNDENGTNAGQAYVWFYSSPCQVSLISPSGGETWCGSTPQNITWTSENTSGNMCIDYSTNGGTSWNTIVSNTLDDGSYSWVVPHLHSDNCLVRICDCNNQACCDESDGSFSIHGNPDFSLSAVPAIATVEWFMGLLGTATYDVTVTSLDCFYGTVNLNVTGLPPGTRRYYFDPDPVVSVSARRSVTVRLVVEVTRRASVGDFTLTITGDDGNVTRSDDVTLQVRRPPRGDRKSVDNVGGNVPEKYALTQNYPNPFNPETSIQFSVIDNQTSPHVTLKIYNILGQEVRTLVDNIKQAGHYTVSWDGRDDAGLELPSGIYLYTLKTGLLTDTKQMVLMK